MNSNHLRLIIFDLDGVLVSAKNIHYEALNEALGDKYAISWNEHLSTYDGLKTVQKLDMLTKEKGLPISKHQAIWEQKQILTLQKLSKVKPNKEIILMLGALSSAGYKIVVASNSIRKTVLTVLSKMKIMEYMDFVISNEDVQNSKPHPEMYWKSMSVMGCLPEETLIVEDSPYGLLAASRSNSHILRVKNPKDLTYKLILAKLKKINMGETQKIPKWTDEKLNVLIPMAGVGSRFEKVGYKTPKPLISVNNTPMIQLVVENLNIDANFIYVVQKSHRKKYNLDTLLNLITPNCKIIEVDGITEGAACTTLLAKKHIDNENPLFLANSDQFVEWNSNEFMYKMNETNCDGGIVTFKSTHPKWSFVKINGKGYITEVAEKKPISDNATVGFYYWKHGSSFVKYAEEMIEKNIRVNGEYYVCPVFNQALLHGEKIRTWNADKMWGIGDPSSLDYFLKNYKI